MAFPSAVESLGTKKRHGRRRIEDQYPIRAGQALAAYAVTRNAEQAAKLSGVSAHAIMDMAKRHEPEFAEIKKEIARSHAINAAAAMCKVAPALERCTDAYKLTLIGAISTDKMLNALGDMPSVTINIGQIVSKLDAIGEKRAQVERALMLSVSVPKVDPLLDPPVPAP